MRFRRWHWDPATRQSTPVEVLRALGGGLFSAHTGAGVEQAQHTLGAWLEAHGNDPAERLEE